MMAEIGGDDEVEQYSEFALPPSRPCDDLVFERGSDTVTFHPWYDPDIGLAGISWEGSAVPSGWVRVRSISFSYMLPSPMGRPMFAVFEHSHWVSVTAGGPAVEVDPGDDFGEFELEIWDRRTKCSVGATPFI